MKLILDRDVLLPALTAVSGVVEKRSTMPVLSNFLMSTEDGKLSITGTNLESEMRVILGGVPVDGRFHTTVPARKLLEITRKGDQNIQLELKDGRVKVVSGHSQYSLAVLPADHFPNVTDDEGDLILEIPEKLLKRMITGVGFAMAQQDARFYLNGLLFEVDSVGMRAVATDGHRLAMAESSEVTSVTSRSAIIPRKGILELAKLLDESSDGKCKLALGVNHVRATVGEYTFTSKLIEGKFPDYRRVLPSSNDKIVVVNVEVIKEALKRGSILCNEEVQGVRIGLSQSRITITGSNDEQESSQAVVFLDKELSELDIAFNVRYLLDVVNTIPSEEVEFRFADASSSALIKVPDSDDFLYVVMPLKL